MIRSGIPITRRRFLAKAGTTVSAPLIVPRGLLGWNAPSNRITLGFIGTGNHGMGRNLGTFLQQPDAVVLAVCDVRKAAAEEAKSRVDRHYGNNDCTACQDFRQMINRDDLDVIVISTPDQWHVPLSMAALRAGKDVFCEKPSLTIAEGRELVDEVGRRGAVFQWGIEDRSLMKYHLLAGWARSGAIGELKAIHVGLPNNGPRPKEGPVPVPAGLDWNLWLGPAPFHDYTPTRTGPAHWRMIMDYSGGMITDWGAHLVDTAQIGARMDHSGPVEIAATAELPEPEQFQSNVPFNFTVNYRYSNGVEMIVKDEGVDIRFEGTRGWVRCEGWDGQLSASSDDILRIREFGEDADYWERPPIEHRDFLDSVKSRRNPAYHVEAGRRLSTALHLGHIAARTGKTVHWDPDVETFEDAGPEILDSLIYKRPARDWAAAAS